jgi:hypothetical protein
MEIMFIASKKRKENLAEFILYMYQVEDLIRAFKLDMELIRSHIILNYDFSETQLAEVTDWYSNLILIMEKEGIRYSGHLQFLNNHVNQLYELHQKLIGGEQAPGYLSIYKNCIGLINEFRLKGDAAANDVATCLDAIYGYLLLKIQKKKVSTATEDAIKQFAVLMRYLSEYFKDYEDRKFEI